MRLPDLATELAVGYVRRSRGETHGELTVMCALPGTRSSDGHIHQATFNLSGSEARNRLAKTLTARADIGIDWVDVLEDLCRRVLAKERAGDPIEKVGALPVPIGETYRLDPMLPQDQTTILFGDGGVGKSTLAAALAVSVQTGASLVEGWVPRRAPVLYLDWEAGRNSLNRRVRGVAMGGHLPDVVQIDYRNCRRAGPLHAFAEDLATVVDREGYGLVIVDSVGMAAGVGSEGGDANESALRLFSAIGYLQTTVLAIDHINKTDAADEHRKARPYGSIYKGLLARATWELRLSNTERGSFLGLYHTKSNDSAMLAPVSLQVLHEDDGSIRYERLDRMPIGLTKSLTQRDQIVAVLREYGHMTADEIADVLSLAENKVRAVLSRHGDQFVKLPSGKWEVLGRAV
ncbi:MAG: AAA family ATPase [Chloroflexota bacterium]